MAWKSGQKRDRKVRRPIRAARKKTLTTSNPLPTPRIEPTRSSNRLNVNETEISSAICSPEIVDGRFPVRKVTLILPAKMYCADIRDHTLKKYGIFSCDKCDNWRNDRLIMKVGSLQKYANQQRYGCRREVNPKGHVPIKVKITYRVIAHTTYRDNVLDNTLVTTSIPLTINDIDHSLSMVKRVAMYQHVNNNIIATDNMIKKKMMGLKDNERVANSIMNKKYVENISQLLELNKAKEIDTAVLLARKDAFFESESNIKQLKRKNRYLVEKYNRIVQTYTSGDITQNINELLKGMRYEKRAKLVLELVVFGGMFGKIGNEVGEDYVLSEVRRKFPAWKLCKAKDTAHLGCLNLQGLNAVRSVQELEDRQQGYIASKSAIWREGDELLRKVAYPMLQPTHNDTCVLGEVVELNFEKVVRYVISIHGLTDLATTTSIELAFSLDGASLTQGTSHIFAACKSVDHRSKNKKGELLYVEVCDKNSPSKFKHLQSNKNVYLMLMAYCRDGKAPYTVFFKGWFSWIQKIKQEGLPFRDLSNPAMLPFKVHIPQDTSSIWKALDMGGACKATNLFCHMCACQSYGDKCQLMLFKENHLRCRRFCQRKQRESGHKCFHWETDNFNEIIRKKQMIKVHLLHEEIRFFCTLRDVYKNDFLNVGELKLYYLSGSPKFSNTHVEEWEYVRENSIIKTSVTTANRHQDPKHIDYICPIASGNIRTSYSSLLDDELILRKMFTYVGYRLEQKQLLLRLSIRNGSEIINMRRAVDRWTPVGVGNKQVDVDDTVLCSLHLELRVNESKIGGLLNEGFLHRKTPGLVRKYTEDVEAVVNEGKLGRNSHQNQWHFPLNNAKNGINGEFSLKGDAGKKILAKMDKLIPIALTYHTQATQTKWLKMLDTYSNMKTYLNRRESFTDNMIYEFQEICDDYCTQWASLTSRDGITNYIHFIRAGHVSHYLFLYRSLYKYSQQGFEAMMAKIKSIYHKCTSRGGHGAAERSHILQVCHFLLRMMMWNSGHGDDYFHAKYGSIIDKVRTDDNNLFII